MDSEKIRSHLEPFDKVFEFPIQRRTDLTLYEGLTKQDPKTYPSPTARIFPGSITWVYRLVDGVLFSELMRYGAYSPSGDMDRKWTTYNARRDNLLSPFWRTAFQKIHGFVAVQSFYEWVKVEDLIRSGLFGIKELRSYFETNDAGNEKKATHKSSQKPLLDRKIVIEFSPKEGDWMVVPVICNPPSSDAAKPLPKGFALITDDPPPEVVAAGHDRCPIPLKPEYLKAWLWTKGSSHKTRPSGESETALVTDMSSSQYLQLLGERLEVEFKVSGLGMKKA